MRQTDGRIVEPGTLYLVGTPIGNLGDVTRRSEAVLAAVDVILCEDTRVTGMLLQAIHVDRPKEAFHQHNTMRRLPSIISRLQAGQAMALVSDRGMPTVSDPGRELVEACHREGIAVSVIPGASALTVAFAGSGYSHPLLFWGFLPARGKERREALQGVAETVITQVFYEAPHRLTATITDFSEVLGEEREITVARELTKPYEQFWQGTLAEASRQIAGFRGELVLLLAPIDKARIKTRIDEPSPQLWLALQALVEEALAHGEPVTDAVRRIASQFRVPRRDLYDLVKGHDD